MTTCTATLKIKHCPQCPHFRRVPDPDPQDSFCSDDEAALCALAPNKKGEKAWASDVSGAPWPSRPLTVSERPYDIERACSEIPEWCPLLKEKRKGRKK